MNVYQYSYANYDFLWNLSKLLRSVISLEPQSIMNSIIASNNRIYMCICVYVYTHFYVFVYTCYHM